MIDREYTVFVCRVVTNSVCLYHPTKTAADHSPLIRTLTGNQLEEAKAALARNQNNANTFQALEIANGRKACKFSRC